MKNEFRVQWYNKSRCDRINIFTQESPPAWTQEAYRPPRSHSNFLLFRGGGGVPRQKFFFQSEHVSSQIWCQKFFPLLWGEGGQPLTKFFSGLNMYQAKSGVKIFSLYWGGGDRAGRPLTKIFFLVWTCIKPNLVSKNFPFTGEGGGPSTKKFFPVWTCIKPNLASKNFPFTETRYPPPLNRHTPVKT